MRAPAAALLLVTASAAIGARTTAPMGASPQVTIATGQIGDDAQAVDSFHPLVTAGLQEAFTLAVANAAGSDQSVAAPTGGGAFAAGGTSTVWGGSYLFVQSCSSYGTIALQALGPDKSTWTAIASYTATDSAASHLVTLGSNARVRVLLTGTAGCAAVLSRVPE